MHVRDLLYFLPFFFFPGVLCPSASICKLGLTLLGVLAPLPGRDFASAAGGASSAVCGVAF